ncbi:TIGR01777 family oxidoreductase [Candidatus Spongiihabitans sp.]|uniref:TIGR01777 family oxidoreductase n=1 Tax=Candidatus Spongiihabitans sp. TaxID=3101308 RepID=UPI003C7AD6F2
MRILVTGGTGFIGQALLKKFTQQGHVIIVLTRQAIALNTQKQSSNITYIKSLDEIGNQNKIDVIINLAGEPIAGKRWSEKQKQLLVHSRVGVTEQLVGLIRRLEAPPECLLSASAIGYYGAQNDRALDEHSEVHDEFTHRLCQRWEQAARQAEELDVRVCIMRLGIVLGPGGGALGKMLPAFRLGLGGKLGSGEQVMSWIHRSDVIAVVEYLMNSNELHGVFNLTSPQPVTNAEFAKQLGRALSRPSVFSMPGFAVKLLFGEMGDRLLLHGQRVIPKRLLDNGFALEYEHLNDALRASLSF